MDLSKDERFRKVSKDPRFWEMPVKEQKIKIDKRFKAMFHEKQFKLKYTVDKRGRPFIHTSGEDLKKFYKLSDEDIEDDDALNEDHLPQITDDRTKRVTSTQRPPGRVGPFKHRDVEGKTEKHCSELKKKRNEVKSKQKANKQTTDKDEVKKNDDVQKRSLNKKQERDFETSDRVHCSKDKTQTSGKIKEQIVSPMKTPQSRRAAVPLTSGSERNEFDKRCKDDVERIEEEDDDSEADDGNSEEIEDSNDDESDSETEEEEGIDHCGPDFARGGGELESSSDEEEFFELFENEPETVEHAWGELANDAQRDDTVTRRLALCNMDWDRIKAKDLLLLFDSFKPKGGVIFSVKIYPSEIGKKRMKDDELYGPQELKDDKFNIDENIPEKQNRVKKMFMETMRQYQMNRLKYHFAVIDCDSVETASAIYKGCDGFEFECSGSFIDLRFVPDEMTFDDEPKDVSEELDAASFKPKYFTTAALRQSKVELTWDEGDHDRVQVLTRKRFSQDEILDMDVKAYLASSSSSEEDAEDLMVRDNAHEEDEEVTQSSVETKMCEADVINKYKELLKSIQEEDDKKQQNDMEMEITWVPGLKENAKEMVRRSTEAKKKLIPQQNYLEKKKQERKQRVKEKRKMAKGPQVEVGSDDDLPPGVDFNNEFHAEERQKPGMKSLKLKGTKKRECDSGVSAEDQAENDKQNALLSLLMMDEEVDDRKHFDYDNIVNQQNLTKRKKRMLLKKNDKLMQEDNFQVDVQDPRFTALYSSHLFNLDPTNPSFRRTKATEALVQEKARRRCLEQEPVIPKPGCSTNAILESTTSEETKKHTDSSLALLVKSVKAKAQQHHASKRPKLK